VARTRVGDVLTFEETDSAPGSENRREIADMAHTRITPLPWSRDPR
jgi:hypothetical protein